jgi:hypothetical protein
VVEAVEDGEHDQQAERQGPGQVRAQAGAPPVPLHAHELEQRADAQRDHDRGHDQAGHRDVEDQPGPAEAAAEGEAGQEGDRDRQHHDDQAELQRALEAAADVADRLGRNTSANQCVDTPWSGKTSPPVGPGTRGP